MMIFSKYNFSYNRDLRVFYMSLFIFIIQFNYIHSRCTVNEIGSIRLSLVPITIIFQLDKAVQTTFIFFLHQFIKTSHIFPTYFCAFYKLYSMYSKKVLGRMYTQKGVKDSNGSWYLRRFGVNFRHCIAGLPHRMLQMRQ